MDAAINVFSAASASDCLVASAVAQLASTSPENALYQRGWRLAYLIASNIGDHLAAIGDVAGAREARPFAHMTLARAALEGAARLWFLMYPPGSVGDRVHRAAALLLGSSDEEAKAVDEIRSWNPQLHNAAAQGVGRRHRELLDLLERAGMTAERTRDGRLRGVRWHTSEGLVRCTPNATALLRELLPDRPGAYRVGSGALHSQPWVLDDEDAFDMGRDDSSGDSIQVRSRRRWTLR